MAEEEGDELSLAHVEEILDVFGDERLNKYLIYGILECIVVRLVPELAEMTPSELLAERGIVVGDQEELLQTNGL